MYLHPKDILKYMRSTKSEWPELKVWLNTKKNKKDILSIFEIAEQSESIEFALFSARALGNDYDETARKMSLAFAIGVDECFEAILEEHSELEDDYHNLVGAILGNANNNVSDSELKNMRYAFSQRISMYSNKSLTKVCDCLIAAAAPFPWGAGLVSHKRSLDAAAAIQKKREDLQAEQLRYNIAVIKHMC